MLTFHPSDALLYNEMVDENSSSLTSIVLFPNSTPFVSVIPPLITNNEVIDKDELNEPLIKKRRSTRTILMADVSRRLRRRKVLHNRLCTISNIMCFLGLLGIILMIIENEKTFTNINHKQTTLSFLLKTIISITTSILVCLIVYYNHLNLKLYAVNNSLDSWRVGLTKRKTFLILLEIAICLIHPFPQYFPVISNQKPNNSILNYSKSVSYIEIDVALSLPMFARIYLLCRSIIYHSHLVHNASSQSLGYLNRVSIHFIFLIKTYLEQWPTRSLLTFSIFICLIGSWSLRACSYNSKGQHLSMPDSMWLFIVTFTTVGYGDLTPSTYCGRSIATIIGLIGILSTALLISVLAQKLKLTRPEKYVHNFVLNIQLAKERKIQAANVIKYALRVWYLKRKYRPISNEYIKAQRRLVRSIHFQQQLKHKQNELIDNCIGFPELITTQRQIYLQVQQNTQQSILMKSKMDQIEEKLIQINQTMMNLQNTLNHSFYPIR